MQTTVIADSDNKVPLTKQNICLWFSSDEPTQGQLKSLKNYVIHQYKAEMLTVQEYINRIEWTKDYARLIVMVEAPPHIVEQLLAYCVKHSITLFHQVPFQINSAGLGMWEEYIYFNVFRRDFNPNFDTNNAENFTYWGKQGNDAVQAWLEDDKEAKQGIFGTTGNIHGETSDWVIADLMNYIQNGDNGVNGIDKDSHAAIELIKACNIYWLERGYSMAQLPDIWSGELEVISS